MTIISKQDSFEQVHQQTSFRFQIDDINKHITDQISKIIRNQKSNAKMMIVPQTSSQKFGHQCQKCECEGNADCGRKISYLESKVRYLMEHSPGKQISCIYDIEKMGLGNLSYLVEYTDFSLQKVSVNYLKKHYLRNYVECLQRSCFGC